MSVSTEGGRAESDAVKSGQEGKRVWLYVDICIFSKDD